MWVHKAYLTQSQLAGANSPYRFELAGQVCYSHNPVRGWGVFLRVWTCRGYCLRFGFRICNSRTDTSSPVWFEVVNDYVGMKPDPSTGQEAVVEKGTPAGRQHWLSLVAGFSEGTWLTCLTSTHLQSWAGDSLLLPIVIDCIVWMLSVRNQAISAVFLCHI